MWKNQQERFSLAAAIKARNRGCALLGRDSAPGGTVPHEPGVAGQLHDLHLAAAALLLFFLAEYLSESPISISFLLRVSCLCFARMTSRHNERECEAGAYGNEQDAQYERHHHRLLEYTVQKRDLGDGAPGTAQYERDDDARGHAPSP